MAEKIAVHPGFRRGMFGSSPGGVLAFRTGSGDHSELVWLDREGKPSATVASGAVYGNPSLSPDARRVAFDGGAGVPDIWILDVQRGSTSRFTVGPGPDNFPIWSPDGQRIVYASASAPGGRFNLHEKPSAGAAPERILLKADAMPPLIATDWSRDGRHIAYFRVHPKTKNDVWVLPLVDKADPYPVVATDANEQAAVFAPDGRWVAYMSDETNRWEVYVQPFPPTGSRGQLSVAGGVQPRWRPDGRELST